MSKSDQSKEVAVSIKNVSKSFRLPHEKQGTIKNAFINMFNGKRTYEKQQVLNNISFDIKKGEFFGIVGRNGSGKSTLLKLISQIYTPDKGNITVNGKLTPFIELGVGFNPELSGRDNVYLNGALLGFTREEMSSMYDEIVEFAELEKFMDQKLKNYSSGMQVRLAFSIAIRANTDILVLDEVLAVGDEAFQKKCYSYFTKLKKDKKTVILVTHSMDSVQQYCNRAAMIEHGQLTSIGNPARIAQKYRKLFMDNKSEISEGLGNTLSSVNNTVGVKADIVLTSEEVVINVNLKPKLDIDDIIVSLFLDRDTGEQVYRFSSDERIGRPFSFKKDKSIKFNIKLQNIFPNGRFTLRASVKSSDRSKEYAILDNLAEFEIDRRIETGREWDIHWQPKEVFDIDQEGE